MADTKLSDLTAASTLDGTELFYGVQAGIDTKVTVLQIKTVALTSAGLLGVGTAVTITAGAAATASDNGSAVSLISADGGATEGSGGAITVQAGAATTEGQGGRVFLNAGNAAGNNHGGNLEFGAGAGTGTGQGGVVNLNAGQAVGTGAGGDIAIGAGAGGITSGNGGDIFLSSGAGRVGDSDGGDIALFLGAKSGAGVIGHFKLELEEFADDAAAATGGVPVNGWYRTASIVKVRVA